MISLIPLTRLIVYIAAFYAIGPVVLALIFPSLIGSNLYFSPIKAAFAGAAILNTLLWLLFSFGWCLLWKIFPILNTAVFPDLNGQWKMNIHWARQGHSGIAEATANIKQDFLKISMEVHSHDSDSETLLAHPKKDHESGRPALYYVYRVIPKRISGKLDPAYGGSAVLKVSQRDMLTLEGNYFTDAESKGYFILTRME